jgi:O-acetylhomoserine (thiol)-lyase
MGIEFTFISPDSTADELEKAFKPNTKALFAESISNPSLSIIDFDMFSAAAKRHGVPFIVDNTFPTPINFRPFEHGVDIITHSTTKYMDGHATSVGGCVIDGGKFDWAAHADKYPGLTTPDDSYHGIVYTEKFGKAAYITKMLSQLMRDLGSIPSPHNAFMLNVGLETLALRMKRHCENALEVAKFLESDDRISWIEYPGLESSKYHKLAQKYMPNGTCGVIAFGVKGGREAANKFMDNLKLAAIVTHVADARTCILHPASTTHRQLTDTQLLECGISPDLLRLSVGIEHASDIIDDIKQALEKI